MKTPHTRNFLPPSIGVNLLLSELAPEGRKTARLIQMDNSGEFQKSPQKNNEVRVRESTTTLTSRCGDTVKGNAGLKRKLEVSHEAADTITTTPCEQKRRQKIGDLEDQIKALVIPFMKERGLGHRVTLTEVFKSAIMRIRFHEDRSTSQTTIRALDQDLSLPAFSKVLCLFPNSKEFSREQKTRWKNKYRERRRRYYLKMLLAKLEKMCVPLQLQQCIKKRRILKYVLDKLKSLPYENCTIKCGFQI